MVKRTAIRVCLSFSDSASASVAVVSFDSEVEHPSALLGLYGSQELLWYMVGGGNECWSGSGVGAKVSFSVSLSEITPPIETTA